MLALLSWVLPFLPQPEKSQDSDNDHDEPDHVDDVAHGMYCIPP